MTLSILEAKSGASESMVCVLAFIGARSGNEKRERVVVESKVEGRCLDTVIDQRPLMAAVLVSYTRRANPLSCAGLTPPTPATGTGV
jgi:hypothetical protein